MADTDFYAYSKNNVGSYLYSSDYASLYMENFAGGTPMSTAIACSY